MAIRQKKLTLGISIIATAAVVAAVFWWQQRPDARTASSMTPPSASRLSAPLNKANESSPTPQGKPAPVTAQPTSIRQRMKTAKDWYALAKEILPLAKAGDPEAQYVLFETYRFCSYKYQTKRASEKAARERATSIGLSADNAAMWFGRCDGFLTDEAKSLGDPWDWLQKATDAGYPMAQVTTVSERLSQDQSKAFVRAGAQPTGTATLPPLGGAADPRDLLVLAAQSADPEVLRAIGGLQHELNPTQPKDVTNINTAAWGYVACQRGADCSFYGPATVTNCGPNGDNCTPVPNTFLNSVNNNWAPVQEKVNQINAVLNAKQWDQLPDLIAAGG